MSTPEKPDAARRSDSALSTGTLEVTAGLIPHIPHEQSVLEVGCGNGHLSERILQQNNRLCGIDISEAAIAECRRKFGTKGRFLQADVLTFATDERFDAAFINEVLDQIPDDDGVLRAVFRLLQPGGRLVLSTPITESRFIEASVHVYDEQQIRAKVLKAGFELEAEESYGGILSYLAAIASKKIRFPKPLLAKVRGLWLYKVVMAADARLKLKQDRLILVCRKPES